MSEQTGLRLYDYPGSCNCYKVRLLLAQLGLPYERVSVDIFNGETLTEEFARINPARTTPVLELDGRFLPDSNAILVYLARGTAFLPEDRLELAEVVRWLVFEQADIVATLGSLRFRLLVGRLAPSDQAAIKLAAGAHVALRVLEDHLATRTFLVGERYTIADIAVYGYTHRAHEAGLDLGPYPELRGWLARVETQPRFLEDIEPYGANAALGAGRSIYD